MWILPQSFLKFKKENPARQIKHLWAELHPVFSPKQAVPRTPFNAHIPNLQGPKRHSNQPATAPSRQKRASVSQTRMLWSQKIKVCWNWNSAKLFPFFFLFFSKLPFAKMKGKELPLGDSDWTLLTQPKFNFCEVHN